MLPKKPLRGHRRTMSSNFEEAGLYVSTAPDRICADEQTERPLTHRPLASTESDGQSSVFSEDNAVGRLIRASTVKHTQKTVVVEQLETELQLQDPLFQFGKARKAVDVGVPKLAFGKKLSSKQEIEDLFMIPELAATAAKFFKKKCEDSRETKATEGSNAGDRRVKPCSPYEGTKLGYAVIGRMKAEKKEAAKQRELQLTQRTKARLNILRTR